MGGCDDLTCLVQAGELIKPWLILGPFYEDLSAQVVGLTYFEKPGATVGRVAMAEIVEDAGAILATSPREGDEDAFRGQAARWNLVRRPEKYLSWGTYNISNHLGAAFLSTVVTPDMPGLRHWRLFAGISLHAMVVKRPCSDSVASRPVLSIRKHPVPYVFLIAPGWKHP